MSAAPNNGFLFNYDAAGNALLGFAMAGAYASLTALKASTGLQNDALYLDSSTGALWRYASDSVLTSDGDFLVAVVAAGGALLRVDKDVDITAAVTKDTADATVIYTVPTGFQLFLGVPFWHVTTSWSGGSSSAIGLSSSGGALTTKGDLLGGSSGDVAAGLLSTGAYAKGTVGTDIGKPGALLVGGDTIKFDQITSTFTAGAATVHIPVRVLLAPAA